MESAKEIQKKFDKLFAEAHKSPLPKLKFRRPSTQELLAKSNRSSKSSSSTSKASIPEDHRGEVSSNHLEIEEHLPNGLHSPPIVERVEQIPETMLPPSNINCSFTEVIKCKPAFISSSSQQQHAVSDVVEGSGRAHVSDSCDEDAKDIDDNEVSSVIGEEEEFFLHKPRPIRNTLCSKARRLNLDGLWSNLIIRKTPAVKNYGIQEGHRCFLRRNLRRCIIFFEEYILRMELLQRDQQLKMTCDAKVRPGAVEFGDQTKEGARVTTNKRGTKRKSLSEVNATKPNKLNKPAGLSRKNAKQVKTTNALEVKRVRGRSRNIENKTKTPDVIKVEKRKGRSSKVENKKQPSDAIKLKNPSGNPHLQPSGKKSKKKLSLKTTKRASREKNVVVLAKPEETESSVVSTLTKTKATRKPRHERHSIDQLINAGEICNGDKSKAGRGKKEAWTCAKPHLVNIKKADKSAKVLKTIVASHNQTSRQTKQKNVSVREFGNIVASKVQPLSPCATAAESTNRTNSKVTGVAIDLPSVAIDDPLVAASMREDWGIGMRPLFSSTLGRTHSGGIWKTIIDEQGHC